MLVPLVARVKVEAVAEQADDVGVPQSGNSLDLRCGRLRVWREDEGGMNAGGNKIRCSCMHFEVHERWRSGERKFWGAAKQGRK